MQRTTICYGPYYDYITQRYDVITNRTTQRCDYITATLHYATLPFLAAYRIYIYIYIYIYTR